MSMLSHAVRDYGTAELLYQEKMVKSGEEMYINDVCYHIQQCIEKCLKYLIENKGERYEFTHDIFILCETCISLYQDDIQCSNLLHEIIEKSNNYTMWESFSRYTDGFKETLNNIQKGFKHCEALLDICKNMNVG